MMKASTYKTEDGHTFRASSAAELVTQLHEVSMAPAEDDAAWMEQTAKRTKEQTGKSVSFENADDFIADLLKLGLIRVEE